MFRDGPCICGGGWDCDYSPRKVFFFLEDTFLKQDFFKMQHLEIINKMLTSELFTDLHTSSDMCHKKPEMKTKHFS